MTAGIASFGRSARLLAGLACAVAVAACAPGAPTMTGGEIAGYERQLLGSGKLRTDRAPPDVPFTNADLVENFARVAFGRNPADDRFGRSRVDELHRWEEPIRWQVHVSGADPAGELADVRRSFARLGAATGLDIAQADSTERSNFSVLFLGPEDYAPAIDWARSAVGRDMANRIRAFRTSGSTCNLRVYPRRSADRGGPKGSYVNGVVLIRAGYSAGYRLGCVEEELAQAMGLPTDDPRVRPSVFNDDEEFALLTTHDEMLLRILYDPRLRAGMSAAEAMPVVARIVRELRPGG